MKISYNQVETQCNQLHSVAKNMKELLENINGIGSKISNGDSWSGSASDKYIEKLNLISKNFDEIFLEIENSILYMASCSDGYQAIDEKIMNEICSNLKIGEPNLNTSSIFNGG